MRHDEEDELFEKDIDELAIGFHMVNENEEDREEDQVGPEDNLSVVEDDDEEDSEIPSDEFSGNDFDFEKSEE